MALYKIVWKLSAKKELKKIDKKEIPNIIKAIEQLSNDPYKNAKKLVGTKNFYRIRVKDYRVIYMIENDKLIIEIIRVKHRKDVYKKI